MTKRAHNFQNLSGKRFGRLVVIDEAPKGIRNKVRWQCLCDCGNEVVTYADNLRSGHTSSCGCLSRDISRKMLTTHGKAGRGNTHPLFRVWMAIKNRCYNQNSTAYKDYGGRGIKLCKEWQEFQPFYEWAMKNGYKTGLEIDRTDNDSGYCPENCRFITAKQNNRNKRNNRYITIDGETKTLSAWSELYNLNHTTILHRLRDGWKDKELLVPPGHNVRA